mgnify:CR=1 FL=1
MVLADDPHNGCHQHLCPQGASQRPPASLIGSPKPASGSDTGACQTSASLLELGPCELLPVPFKDVVFVSCNPLSLHQHLGLNIVLHQMILLRDPSFSFFPKGGAKYLCICMLVDVCGCGLIDA